MIKDIKTLLRKPTPLELAVTELVDAERAKLQAETGREYAEAQCAYHAARISRLKKYITATTKEQP